MKRNNKIGYGIGLVILAIILGLASRYVTYSLILVPDGHGGFLPYSFPTYPYQGLIYAAVPAFLFGIALLASGMSMPKITNKTGFRRPERNSIVITDQTNKKDDDDNDNNSEAEYIINEALVSNDGNLLPDESLQIAIPENDRKEGAMRRWYCQDCGRENPTDTVFCGKCGSKKR